MPESSTTVTLPETDDLEQLKVKISTFERDKKVLPRFISFDAVKRTYTIAPTKADMIRKYPIVVKLEDEFGAEKQYQFFVNLYLMSSVKIPDIK